MNSWTAKERRLARLLLWAYRQAGMPCKCPEGSICEHEMHAVRLAMSEGVTGPEPHQQDLDFELIEEARAVANSYPGKFGVDADLVKKLLSVIDRRAATQ